MNRKALIVGIDKYKRSPLNGCVNDAEAMHKLLEYNEGGTRNFFSRIERNVPTRSSLTKQIRELFSGDAETVLFYFAGHGYINELGGYIVTPDHDSYDEGVSTEDILKFANNSKARDKIVILDCCHSGIMGSPELHGGASHLKDGVTILTASRSTEKSVEKGGHGIFTSLLLQALNGGAADLAGRISPGSIYAFVDKALGPWDQRPVFKTNVSRFVSVRSIVPRLDIKIVRALSNLFPTPDTEKPLNPSFEDTNSPDYKREIMDLTKPFAIPENVSDFKRLQELVKVGLVEPHGADHMYFAAMKSKHCRLTALGKHYWKLANEGKL